jgi:hypothetical protein
MKGLSTSDSPESNGEFLEWTIFPTFVNAPFSDLSAWLTIQLLRFILFSDFLEVGPYSFNH